MEDSIDNIKLKVRKIQVAFKDNMPEDIKTNKDILKIDKRGKVYEIIVNDNMEKLMNEIEKYNPLLLETMDMSLEEIFIYKMGGVGYVFEDAALQ